jgi:hypothetical protein
MRDVGKTGTVEGDAPRQEGTVAQAQRQRHGVLRAHIARESAWRKAAEAVPALRSRGHGDCLSAARPT